MANHGQNEHARRALRDLFVHATLNQTGDDASLALAAKVMRTALLGDAGPPTSGCRPGC
jgi:hypothetical protein